jgi:riboflavin synthase
MFSGIIETTSPVLSVRKAREQHIVSIQLPKGWRFKEGESVSVSGVCSTVQNSNRRAFEVTYMPETLRRTTLGKLKSGPFVNLERSLRLNSLIGGHLVQGHVDTTARIRSVRDKGEARIYEFALPRRFSRYIIEKGSIAVDGVSLTVVTARPGHFTVSLLAYTLTRTTLGRKGRGDAVNIELDLLAKYIEKLAAA